ncbi:MAG: hypothetical protein H6731_01770 [Myxococcales bacterium]|nr:MAG: hypothetical protein H6731_01770 [Myxococcales bacterium]
MNDSSSEINKKDSLRISVHIPEVKVLADSLEKSADKFTKKKRYIIIKALGISTAVFAGIFGYLLQINTEYDNKQAATIRKKIEDKRFWVQKIDIAIMELRKTTELIKQSCRSKKPISMEEQKKERTLARIEFIKSFSGILQYFDKEVLNLCLQITSMEESVPDICVENVLQDNKFQALMVEVNKKMESSIEIDQAELANLHRGVLSNILKVL